MYVCSANGEHVNSQEGVFSSTHTMYNIVIILQKQMIHIANARGNQT